MPMTTPASRIHILGTGGTIAGRSHRNGDSVDYTAAQITIADLLTHIPGLDSAAAPFSLHAEQAAQLDSKDMDDATWHHLAHRCRTLLQDPGVAAIVITHGTDTVEETAWFLHCVLPPGKPVVLTCAMRPATSISADGPANLHDAIACAADSSMRQRAQAGEHVVLVAAGTIHTARHVRKVHPVRTDAFSCAEHGPLGWMEASRPRWAHPIAAATPAPHPHAHPAPLPPADTWPWVEILHSHAGARARTVQALVNAGVSGLIVAGTGNGTIHTQWQQALARARQAGVTIWRCSRCESGRIVLPAGVQDPYVTPLPAAKARISLMLALMPPA